ncbi:MAG TPA: hypothetical protein VML54_11870 [Candidatus Limnocylindrales bacterium]|nr:hypothetical protein [Candidatus Limnocylindrales bacterium]
MDDRAIEQAGEHTETEGATPEPLESDTLKKEWEKCVARARRVGKWRELIG